MLVVDSLKEEVSCCGVEMRLEARGREEARLSF